PAVENASYFNVLPPVAVGFPTVNNSVVTQNFCIVPNGVHSDAEIVISPIVAANPGFDAVYQISYKNKGNQTLSGSFNFSYDETVLDLVSASLAPATQLPGSLVWSFSNLLPFESRNLY